MHFLICRSLYDNPAPSSERVEDVMVRFIAGVKGKLKSRSNDPHFCIEFDHDIFRYIFNGKGYPSNITGATRISVSQGEIGG